MKIRFWSTFIVVSGVFLSFYYGLLAGGSFWIVMTILYFFSENRYIQWFVIFMFSMMVGISSYITAFLVYTLLNAVFRKISRFTYTPRNTNPLGRDGKPIENGEFTEIHPKRLTYKI